MKIKKKRKKQQPKPTHHIVVPKYEDYHKELFTEIDKTEFRHEQSTINNLIDYILENDKNIDINTDDTKSKYNFILEFCKFYKKMFDVDEVNKKNLS